MSMDAASARRQPVIKTVTGRMLFMNGEEPMKLEACGE
jgi:hypothetical protein